MNDDLRWQAVATRDASQDGQFFYAVRSTGIYCRPSCPARRPRREQVQFFSQADAAEQAGFRACLRCRPRETGPSPAQRALAQRACQLIDQQLDAAPTLSQLGAQIGVSPFHLQRTFKQVVGLTPRQYATARRIDRLKQQLKQGDTVTDAIYEAGYSSSSRAYAQAPAHLGMTPATYQRGGAGAHIRYAIVAAPTGQLLLAATERGICFVGLADTPAALEATLAGEFPAATRVRDDDALGGWAGALLGHLADGEHLPELPLDIRASAFQSRVWQALVAIPYGSTRTYGEIAAALGQPSAARAVAHACASNPVALVVPCHRVVGAGGDLRGYRWGIARKRELLAREASAQAVLEAL